MRNLAGKNTSLYGDSNESIFKRTGRAEPSIPGGGVNVTDCRFLTGP